MALHDKRLTELRLEAERLAVRILELADPRQPIYLSQIQVAGALAFSLVDALEHAECSMLPMAKVSPALVRSDDPRVME